MELPRNSLCLTWQEGHLSWALLFNFAAAAAKSLQSCPTLCDPKDGSPPGSPDLGFSRQEHWSGLPFPSPMHESESEVARSCLTLSDPMDCSLPGSSVHGIFQTRVLEWGAIAFSKLWFILGQKRMKGDKLLWIFPDGEAQCSFCHQ